MTIEELREFVDQLETFAKQAPDNFDVMRKVVESSDDLWKSLARLGAEQDAILDTLPAEIAEKLKLCSRGTSAIKRLLGTGEDWVRILDKHNKGKDW